MQANEEEDVSSLMGLKAIATFASLWAPRNRQDIYNSRFSAANLRYQEYAADGAGA